MIYKRKGGEMQVFSMDELWAWRKEKIKEQKTVLPYDDPARLKKGYLASYFDTDGREVIEECFVLMYPEAQLSVSHGISIEQFEKELKIAKERYNGRQQIYNYDLPKQLRKGFCYYNADENTIYSFTVRLSALQKFSRSSELLESLHQLKHPKFICFNCGRKVHQIASSE